jgi:DNA-binding MarR family transcriptional regulator
MALFTDMFTELVRVEIELWNGLDAHLLSAAGITLPQYQALDAIRGNAGAARVQDISRRMAITVGATSKVVDRLERDGFAVRTAHPTDRRSSIVSLTDRGASAVEVADLSAESHLEKTLGATLSGAQAGELLGVLTSLRAHVLVEAAR